MHRLNLTYQSTMTINQLKARLLTKLISSCGKPEELTRVNQYILTRYSLKPQSFDNSLQRPSFGLFPGLTAKPWHDSNEFEWITKLKRQAEVIKDEMRIIIKHPGFGPQYRTSGMRGAWNAFYLYAYGKASRRNCFHCPITTKLMNDIPGAVHGGLVLFSALAPRSHIKAHYGVSNTRLRCHLGLSIPEDCRIQVGDETRGWAEGECIVFDDSFRHEVWHNGSELRWVLLIDFWHPDLTPPEQKALQRLNFLFSQERSLRRQLLTNRALP